MKKKNYSWDQARGVYIGPDLLLQGKTTLVIQNHPTDATVECQFDSIPDYYGLYTILMFNWHEFPRKNIRILHHNQKRQIKRPK